MRDPKRIPIVLAKVREVWEKYPDLRLGQLLSNCEPYNLYYLEDDGLIAELDRLQ